MIGDEQRMNSRVDKSRAALARDAAILRVGRTRRWVIAGAAALTAGFAALVSAVAPGRSLASKSPSGTRTTADPRTSSTSSAIPQFPPAANPSSLGLQSPGQPPQSVPNPPQSTAPAPTTPAVPAPQPVAPQPAPLSGGS
jgi:hypothetical protein